jgi:hypothetical protein
VSTRRRAVSTTAATLATALVLSACSPGRQDAPSDGPNDTLTLPPGSGAAPGLTPGPRESSASPTSSGPALPQVSADVVGDLQQLLDARAAAVLAHDRDGFVAGLAPRDSLLTTDGGYFDNLAQLPLAAFSYRLDPASLVRTGRAYWGVVEVTLQLTPYDATPTRTLDRFRFVPAGSGYRVSSTTDRAWEAEHAGLQQPWDTEPVTVREGSGVLGVFDTARRSESIGVVRSVQRGIADVSARVPFDEWGSQVVVYALSDPRFLDGFDDLPGGDPEALDGVAFTVPGADDQTASTRFALSPSLLPRAGARRPDADLDRLVRHELAHVAVGAHDDGVPVWLSEGIAEWVSWQALAPADRHVPAAALAAARRGIRTMPSDESFNDADAAVHYALAWWVCEWLVQTYGPDAPWTVLEAFTRRSGDDPRQVVRDLLKISLDQLAQRSAKLMRTTYDETRSSTPAPSGSTPTE